MCKKDSPSLDLTNWVDLKSVRCWEISLIWLSEKSDYRILGPIVMSVKSCDNNARYLCSNTSRSTLNYILLTSAAWTVSVTNVKCGSIRKAPLTLPLKNLGNPLSLLLQLALQVNYTTRCIKWTTTPWMQFYFLINYSRFYLKRMVKIKLEWYFSLMVQRYIKIMKVDNLK